MPDILIRMEMPKSCADCHDADLPTAIAWLEAKCPYAYGMNKPGVYDLRHKRHPDCPLVELPPHGDLIDQEKIYAEAVELSGPITGDGWDNFGVYDLIKRQPVIVPAKREGEDAPD